MFFYRKAFERLGFRVASEFLYTEYKVMLFSKVQGVYHGHIAFARCTSWSYLVHNCTISLCSLDVRNIDDQCKGPSITEKGHLVA